MYVDKEETDSTDHMPEVFGVFMLGLFFLRSTGIFMKLVVDI